MSVPRAIATSDFQEAADSWAVGNVLSQREWWDSGGQLGNVLYELDSIYSLQRQTQDSTRLEPTECMAQALDILSAWRPVMVVAHNLTSARNNGSSLLDGWLCSTYSAGEYRERCSEDWTDTIDGEWVVKITSTSIDDPNVLVDYCLVGDAADVTKKCGLHYSPHLMDNATACTMLVAFLCILTGLDIRKQNALGNRRQQKLITLGVAIRNFLENPDVPFRANVDGTNAAPYQLVVQEWIERPVSLFRAASFRSWALFFTV